jgi:hypothetical protein
MGIVIAEERREDVSEVDEADEAMERDVFIKAKIDSIMTTTSPMTIDQKREILMMTSTDS